MSHVNEIIQYLSFYVGINQFSKVSLWYVCQKLLVRDKYFLDCRDIPFNHSSPELSYFHFGQLQAAVNTGLQIREGDPVICSFVQ